MELSIGRCVGGRRTGPGSNGDLQIYVEPVKLRQTVDDVPAGSYDL
jgi:hypothetical protein